MNKVRTVEHGGKIYRIAQFDVNINRTKQFINGIHCWLIRRLVGKKPVIMNVRFVDGRAVIGEGAFVFRCVFFPGTEWVPVESPPKLL